MYVKEIVLWACRVSSPDLISIENVLGYIINFAVQMIHLMSKWFLPASLLL